MSGTFTGTGKGRIISSGVPINVSVNINGDVDGIVICGEDDDCGTELDCPVGLQYPYYFCKNGVLIVECTDDPWNYAQEYRTNNPDSLIDVVKANLPIIIVQGYASYGFVYCYKF